MDVKTLVRIRWVKLAREWFPKISFEDWFILYDAEIERTHRVVLTSDSIKPLAEKFLKGSKKGQS